MKPIYILVLLMMAAPAHAREACEAFVTSLWSAEALPEGFALGFDSEIPAGQAMTFLRQDPGRAKSLSRILQRLRIDSADMARYVGMSESQFRSFGLRPHTDKTKPFITMDDWNAETWRRVMHSPHGGDAGWRLRFAGRATSEFRCANPFRLSFDSPTHFHFPGLFGLGFFESLVPLFKSALPALGLPLTVEADCPDFEFKYDGSTSNPRQFRSVVDEFHRIFTQAQTHFHLGIAVRLLPENKAYRIVQALEAMIILEAAAKSEYKESGLAGYSTLVSDPEESRSPVVRGVLGIRFNRWYQPEDMHDLEVRQYLTRESALKMIGTAIFLTRQQARLKDFEVNFDHVNPELDPVTFNLHGALLFMGHVFTQNDRHTEVGNKLLQFAREIEKSRGHIQERLRDRLSEYLLRIDIERLMRPDLFLEAKIQN